MEESATLSLRDAVTHMLDECRMVLPGVQTLFGFQLIAVFQTAFTEDLTHAQQRLHLLSLAMVALAGALVMTPAAYHRQTSPHEVSARLVQLGGRFLLASMVALTLGIALDFYLIAHLILEHEWAAVAVSAVLVAFFIGCWFVFPRYHARSAMNRANG